MSTKNLSRTVIEGGRYKGNKYKRRHSSKVERSHRNIEMKQIIRDPELVDEEMIHYERKSVGKSFKDKLGPVKRFLNSKVGESWSIVFKEITDKFDTTTVAGQHVVYSHMITDVYGSGGQESRPITEFLDEESKFKYGFCFDQYYIDENNILRKIPRKPRKHNTTDYVSTNWMKQFTNWLGGRKIGKVGEHLFWFVPNGHRKDIFVDYYYGGFTWTHSHLNNIGFRQDKKLTKQEVEIFNYLPEKYQKQLLEASPVYKKENEE